MHRCLDDNTRGKRDASRYLWVLLEPFTFIFRCHMCGSARIMCRFHKDFIISRPPSWLSLFSYVARTFIPPSLIQLSQIHASLQRTIDFRFEDFADLIVWLCYLLSLCLVWPGIGFPRPSGGDPKELRKCLAGAFPLFLVVSADVDASSGNNHLQILAWQIWKQTNPMLLILYVFFFYLLILLIHDEMWWASQ